MPQVAADAKPPIQDGPAWSPQGIISLPWARWFNRPAQFQTVTQVGFPKFLAPNSWIFIPEYSHMIYYDGATFVFADGGNRFYVVAAVNPATGGATAGSGWHPADGSTVPALNPDGSITNVTITNTAGSWFRQ